MFIISNLQKGKLRYHQKCHQFCNVTIPFDFGGHPGVPGLLLCTVESIGVHKDTVVACVRHMTDGKITTAVKTFKTTTQDLMALSEWLSTEAATHIAM
jgi:hypothetical protein